MSHAQQVVYDLKSLVTSGKVNSCYVHYGLELTLSVVAEEGHERDDAGRCGVQGEFVPKYAVLLDEFGKALNKVGTI